MKTYQLPSQTDLNDYGTHIPILNVVFDNISLDNIFEYGTGLYSTKLFSEKFKDIVSVEMQDEKWYELVLAQKFNNVTLKCMLGQKNAIYYFNNLNKNFSCVFVDGHGDNRWECINAAFGKTDVIITHDTEEPGYKWDLVNLPNDYVWLDIKTYKPWTAVITKNLDLVKLLTSVFETSIRVFKK